MVPSGRRDADNLKYGHVAMIEVESGNYVFPAMRQGRKRAREPVPQCDATAIRMPDPTDKTTVLRLAQMSNNVGALSRPRTDIEFAAGVLSGRRRRLDQRPTVERD